VNRLAVLMLSLAVSGCADVTYKHRSETGKIVSQSFMPSQSYSGYNWGKGGGFVSGRTQEKYTCVIQCDHHKWVLTGSDAEKVFDSFSEGETVTCVIADRYVDGNYKSSSWVRCEELKGVRN
jgi:hypothetical protein